MKKNGMGKKILISALTAVIVLTMQGPRVFAESLQPESQSETSAEQPEIQPETTGEESVSQNDLPEEEQESQPETTEEESVSENDLSELQSEDQPAVAAKQADPAAYPKLTKEILDECIVPGVNPPGVTINLFDYWQFDRKLGDPIPKSELDHDFGERLIYKLGISKGHLLRFGYTCMWHDENGMPQGCDTCIEKGYFGAWNDSMPGVPYQGIVKNKLGAYGFPELNLDTVSDEEFGGYTKLDANEQNEYLSDEKKVESLAYLFSPSVRLPDYRETYNDVRGLFQPDGDGYYYYSSTKNFASYNEDTNSFILYNSPGVAEYSYNEKSRGEFFPFNKAEDVFDTYTIDDSGKYHLRYVDKKNKGADDSNYYPVDLNDGNTYLNRSAGILNHYLGMTMEFLFQQPKNGCLPSGKPMTFEFTGDDDVWIFIDGVLVADLGGLHGACSLDIDFSTGKVNVEGEPQPHTLLDSFKAAYGEDSDLGGIAFHDNTFADKTDHTLKMFYLERGHGASDLDLKFNIQTMSNEPVKEDPPDEDPDENETPPNEDTDENEESESDPVQENTSEPEGNIISVNDNYVMLDTTGIPQTGDDSPIEWLSALCIMSLFGIGAAACNLIFVRRKQKNHSLKQ